MNTETEKILLRYFPETDNQKLNKFNELINLFNYWNSKINLISRKDIENFAIHHLLHSLASVKVQEFLPQQKVIDIGTGGGLPAIPLAIFFSETQFTLCDSILKKINAVKDICQQLSLNNVNFIHGRAENIKIQYDIVTGRAVTRFPEFYNLFSHLLNKNGNILYWTGENTFNQYQKGINIFKLSDIFEETYFSEKIIVKAGKGLKIS